MHSIAVKSLMRRDSTEEFDSERPWSVSKPATLTMTSLRHYFDHPESGHYAAIKNNGETLKV